MKKSQKITCYLLAFLFSGCASITSAPPTQHSDIVEKLKVEILKNGEAYSNLKELVKGGSRLSGSQGAAHAVEWAKAKLESYGFDKVWLQPVMVPRWERGAREEAVVTSGEKLNLHIAALGSSISTGREGVEAEVIEVSGIEDATAKGDALSGKIVFFNGAMDPTTLDVFEAYSKSVKQRTSGAALAAKFGAVAVLVRSMTLNHDSHPHAGMMRYRDDVKKIPAATLATADADQLSERLKTEKVRLKILLSAENFSTVQSYNVIAELTGSGLPQEYIVVGGHLDSWDLGPGAQDDGAGVVQSIEVLRAFKALKIKPKRSVRAVLFMSEEFGGNGGVEYASQAKIKKEKHIAALESDRGGFTPRGFETSGDEKQIKKIANWSHYLSLVNSDMIKKGGGGTDIEPLHDSGTLQIGLYPDPARYFDYHHASTDTLDAVNARELHLGAAAISILTYLIEEEGI
jgi:carboxypeptidase Q